MTLACEDGNSKLVEVVTVVEVDVEEHVDNSLVQIWKINFDLEQTLKPCLKILTKTQGLFKIFGLMFRQDFEVVSWM